MKKLGVILLVLFGCVGLKAQQRHLLENENALAEIDLRQGALV